MSYSTKQSIAELIEPFAGEWVALTATQSTIVAHSRNLKTALRKAHESGEKFPHMVKVSTESTATVIY